MFRLFLFFLYLLIFFILQYNSQDNVTKITLSQPSPQEIQPTPQTISPTPEEKIEFKVETPKPKPAVDSSANLINYELTPCENDQPGCYSIKNAPQEIMSTQQQLNEAVNNYRIAHNLDTLIIDPQICDLANQRAIEISTDFSHSGFQNHIDAGNYNFTGFKAIGENLWQGEFTGVHIVEFGWDKSPGHRENLLADWTRGCGGVYDNYAAFIFLK